MRKENLYNILLEPHVSEKANNGTNNCRQYAFKVIKSTNKSEVKAAVEKMFGVAVKSVNICNVKGARAIKFGRVAGMAGSWKKAYVVLEAGQEINLA